MINDRKKFHNSGFKLILIFMFSGLLSTSLNANKSDDMAMQGHNHNHAAMTEDETSSLPSLSDDPRRNLFSCPMHPEVKSDKPGKCPKCGMFLTLSMEQHGMPGEVARGHSMEHDHSDGRAGMEMEKMVPYWERSAHDTQDKKTHHYLHTSAVPENMPRMAPEKQTSIPMIESDEEHALKHQDPNYVCPMHPQIVNDKPGGCPICGMDLVLKQKASQSMHGDYPQVFLQPAVIQNLGVRVTNVKSQQLNSIVKAQGQVSADEDRVKTVHPRTGGWVEQLYLVTEGERLERKELVMDFFSPWINEVQLEYIQALEETDMLSFDPTGATEINAKVESLQNSLRQLMVMDMEIMRVRSSRKVLNTIQLRAPQGGVVTELFVREGSYVEPYQPMYTLVDLSNVWVMMDIYEHQASKVRKGQRVSITTEAIPSRVWEGEVDFIYPEVNPLTRTLRARITVKNPDEALLLNMFVEVDIKASDHLKPVVTVPREALIVTGEREVVVKSLGNGHFQPVNVVSGKRDDHYVEIISGLDEGDEIVVSGQFLIDSESSLQASFLRMSQ